MRAVIQRVSAARVEVDGVVVGSIERGVVVLVGIATGDGESDAVALARKISEMRIFSDERGRMNVSLADSGGAALVISQFTLLGNVRKGRRPSFTAAAAPQAARGLVDLVAAELADRGIEVAEGRFGAMMSVSLVNEGPVTIVVEISDGRVL